MGAGAHAGSAPARAGLTPTRAGPALDLPPLVPSSRCPPPPAPPPLARSPPPMTPTPTPTGAATASTDKQTECDSSPPQLLPPRLLAQASAPTPAQTPPPNDSSYSTPPSPTRLHRCIDDEAATAAVCSSNDAVDEKVRDIRGPSGPPSPCSIWAARSEGGCHKKQPKRGVGRCPKELGGDKVLPIPSTLVWGSSSAQPRAPPRRSRVDVLPSKKPAVEALRCTEPPVRWVTRQEDGRHSAHMRHLHQRHGTPSICLLPHGC